MSKTKKENPAKKDFYKICKALKRLHEVSEKLNWVDENHNFETMPIDDGLWLVRCKTSHAMYIIEEDNSSDAAEKVYRMGVYAQEEK